MGANMSPGSFNNPFNKPADPKDFGNGKPLLPESWRSVLFGGLGKKPDPNASQFGDRGYIQNVAQQGIQGAQGRQAPQAGNTQIGAMQLGQAAQINASPQEQFRQQQLQQSNALMAQALGTQQGAGELAAQRQGARMVAQQQAMAAAARGGNAGLAQLGAARNVVDIGGQVAGQAQQAAIQDRMQANQALTQALGTARGADIGLATDQAQLNQNMALANQSAQNSATMQQAQLNQQTSLSNLEAKLKQMGMNDQAIMGYLGAMTGMNEAELRARMGQEQTALSQTGIAGGLLGAAGQIGAAYAMGGAK